MADAAGARTPFLKPEDWAGAFKGAAVTFLIALVLYVPLAGMYTNAGKQNVLVLEYDWPLAFWLTAITTVLRFLADIFIWRQEEPAARLLRIFGADNLKLALFTAVAICYTGGGILLVVPGSSAAVSAATGIQDKWVTLIAVTMMGVFTIVTAMAIMRVMRLLMEGTLIDRASLTAEPLREFAPAMLLVALMLPMLSAGPHQRYALDTAIQVLTYIMLGWGLNVVVGLAGLLDLGYVAFYAVGAYSYALLSIYYGLSFWICLPLAGILAAFWGILLGFPVLRLRGDYLAIVTLAFGEIIRMVLQNWYSFTHGPDGINRIPQLTFFGLPFSATADNSFSNVFGLEYNAVHRIIFFYYVILVLALITNFITMRLRRLPVGRAWEALREDEIACKALGINTVTTKLTAFATGALFAGLAGSFFATRQGFISPESFTFNESWRVLAIVVLGGLGSQMGIIIAAAVLIGGMEFFRDFAIYRNISMGGLMVMLMIWRPRGLISTRTPSVTLKSAKPIGAELVSQGRG